MATQRWSWWNPSSKNRVLPAKNSRSNQPKMGGFRFPGPPDPCPDWNRPQQTYGDFFRGDVRKEFQQDGFLGGFHREASQPNRDLTVKSWGRMGCGSHRPPSFRFFVILGERDCRSLYWLVVGFYPPEKWWSESQLGWLFPRYGKMKNLPNHQPADHCSILDDQIHPNPHMITIIAVIVHDSTTRLMKSYLKSVRWWW